MFSPLPSGSLVILASKGVVAIVEFVVTPLSGDKASLRGRHEQGATGKSTGNDFISQQLENVCKRESPVSSDWGRNS